MKAFIACSLLLAPIFWIMLLGNDFIFSGYRIVDAFLISALCIALIVIGNAIKEKEAV